MPDRFSRTELLLGKDAMERLAEAHVAVFGLGGVGGYVVEALARSGIGRFTLIDDDKICVTNVNRQILAVSGTIGKYKADVAAERIRAINPKAETEIRKTFFLPSNATEFDFASYSYVADAVDTVTAKIGIILAAQEAGVPVISCMGAGNKIDASGFRVADIYQTKVCPLAKVMRSELRKRGVKHLKVVYSEEIPVMPSENDELSCKKNCVCPPGTARTCAERRQVPGSTAFAPAAAGLVLAEEIVCDLTGFPKQRF